MKGACHGDGAREVSAVGDVTSQVLLKLVQKNRSRADTEKTTGRLRTQGRGREETRGAVYRTPGEGSARERRRRQGLAAPKGRGHAQAPPGVRLRAERGGTSTLHSKVNRKYKSTPTFH